MITDFLQKIFDEILTVDSISKLLIISTILVGILNTISNLIEYFKVKAYNDFFIIGDFSRNALRKGIHPEYLLYSIIFTPLIFIIIPLIESNLLGSLKDSITNLIKMISIFIGFSFGLSIIIAFLFNSSAQRKEKLWEKQGFFRTQIKMGALNSIKYDVLFMGVVLPLFFLNHEARYLLAILLLVMFIAIFMGLHYYLSQINIKVNMKRFLIYEENGEKYVMLTRSTDSFYVVRCLIEKDKISLLLYDIKLISINQNFIIRKFASFEREFSMKNEKTKKIEEKS